MSEPRELPNVITPLSIPEVWNALLLRWETLGVPVRRAPIELKLAHVHLETGLKSCHCFNLGNVKYSYKHGGCWTYFACGEEIPESQLAGIERMAPGKVTVRKRYSRGNGLPYCSIWIEPNHPWAKFAAFETLVEGVDRQLVYLRNHPTTLAALQSGDAQAYNDALHNAGYYTAGKAQYLATLKQRLEMVRRECSTFDWGDVA